MARADYIRPPWLARPETKIKLEWGCLVITKNHPIGRGISCYPVFSFMQWLVGDGGQVTMGQGMSRRDMYGIWSKWWHHVTLKYSVVSSSSKMEPPCLCLPKSMQMIFTGFRCLMLECSCGWHQKTAADVNATRRKDAGVWGWPLLDHEQIGMGC